MGVRHRASAKSAIHHYAYAQHSRTTKDVNNMLLVVAFISLCYLPSISSSSSSSSSSSLTPTLSRARRRAAPPSQPGTRLPWGIFERTSKPTTSSPCISDTDSIASNFFATENHDLICDENDDDAKCSILEYESGFDDHDNSVVYHHYADVSRPVDDDFNESINSHWASNYSFRGGGAAASSSLEKGRRLPGLHSGWRRNQSNQQRRQLQAHVRKTGSNPNTNNRRHLDNDKTIQLRNKLQQLDNVHQQKMHQFRRTFRRKQRDFHNAIYYLNSRFNSSSGEYNNNFPKPPYSLWTLNRTQLQQRGRGQPVIGKTTLTGKIFLFNIIMFGMQTIYPQLTSWGAKRSDMILEGRQLHRLLTPVFLHGGLGHLMANSYSLKSMGVNVEMAFGPSRLLATYLVSGIMGNVMSAIQSPNPAVGASGAIFGLVGAYYTFLARNQHLFGYTGQMQKDALVETIGFNLLLGMTNPMIDNWGHIGGFVGGVGMAYLIGPKLYVARVPLLGGGDKDSIAASFSAGKIIIDRPTISFRTPEFVDEGIFWIDNNARKLGRSVKTSVSNIFNGVGRRGDAEYYLDAIVDYCNGMSTSDISNDGDGTIYRTLKSGEAIELEGNANINPSDGFRQNVSELDPTRIRQSSRRLRVPKAGYSIRPRYSHLYR